MTNIEQILLVKENGKEIFRSLDYKTNEEKLKEQHFSEINKIIKLVSDKENGEVIKKLLQKNLYTDLTYDLYTKYFAPSKVRILDSDDCYLVRNHYSARQFLCKTPDGSYVLVFHKEDVRFGAYHSDEVFSSLKKALEFLTNFVEEE